MSNERGATWLDKGGVVWLRVAAAGGRALTTTPSFADLHRDVRLLPTDDDQLRDQAEEATRSFRRLGEPVIELVDATWDDAGAEQNTDFDGWLPIRALVHYSEGVEEIWCAISARAVDGGLIRPEVRDLLFAVLEEHLSPAAFGARYDWPTGNVGWFEAVRLVMR